MQLQKLLENLPEHKIYGKKNIEILNLCFDSRKASMGSLFVAQYGTTTDGHEYLADAIEKGCIAVVINEKKSTQLPNTIKTLLQEKKITTITVNDTNEALGLLASAWFDHPSKKLKVVGITGTNGKTTIATLSFNLTLLLNKKAGLISTIENKINESTLPTEHTTPDALTIQSLLAQMVEHKCQYAFMEVSSHAIDQKRIAGIHFYIAAFTNLTRDHLDYHKTFERYRDTKQSLFTSLSKDAFAITNLDDKNGLVMTQNSKAQIITYSIRDKSATLFAQLIEMHLNGMQLSINNTEFFTPLIGSFNISNLLCIFAIAQQLGFDKQLTLKKMSLLQPAKGRFQIINAPSGKIAIVDYAHTPDALENALKTIQHIIKYSAHTHSKIITVVGCGGNRDKGKRPIMAKIAYANSDQLILTSDNPRFENPQDILQDMTNGLKEPEKKKTICIENRQSAIQTACTLAQPNDIILIAGKGHENYQIINSTKYHFDDMEIAQKYL